MAKTMLLLTVRLAYDGHAVDPVQVKDALENALEYCRQDSMLSPKEWQDDEDKDSTTCDWVAVTSVTKEV